MNFLALCTLVALSITIPNIAFAYASNYDPVLENAKNKLFSFISTSKNSTYLPISSYGVDYQHLTLLVVIDDKAPLTKFVYEQRIQSIVGNIPLTVELGHFQDDVARFTGIGNRTLDTLVKIIPANDTSHPLDRYIQVRFLDTKTNQTIQHVSFFMNITRGDHIVIHDFFHTHSGFFSALLQPNATATTWSVHGDHEPVLYGWVSNNGSMKIVTPQFQNGLYDVQISMTTIDSDGNLFDATMYPKFDSWWNVSGNGNFEKYDGSTKHSDFSNQTTMAIDDKISIIKQSSLSPLKQFKTGITWNNIKCVSGLELIVKTGNNSPACVSPKTSEKLMDRGWGCVAMPISNPFGRAKSEMNHYQLLCVQSKSNSLQH